MTGSKVVVKFTYVPSQPDASDPTGMSEAEHADLMDGLMALGAEDVEIRRA